MGSRRLRGSGEPDLDRLAQDEGGSSAYRAVDGDARAGLLILCDHAENTIPTAFDCLGLKEQDLHRHIAYDLGAASVAERLAESLGAPAILSRFSRLLIDPNRGLDDPTLMMQITDGLIVPGNVGIQREDLAFPIDLAVSARPGRIERVLSNSFGFGGINCSLILGRTRTGGSR